MKIDKNKVLLIVFYILFGISVISDCLIIYDFFDPCRIDMNKCGESFTFNLVHSSIFLKLLGIENLFNIIVSCFVIYKNSLKKKYIFIVLGVISILSTFSLWLLFMGGDNMVENLEKELSFEESLTSLEEIVKKLEVGDVPLDEAINEFNKAMKLAKSCDEKLKNAEEAISKLVNKDGEIVDFKIEE